MGQIINLVCSKCNKNIELMAGQGIKDNDLDRVLLFFDENTGRKIRQAIVSSKNSFWSFERKIALCRRTGDIKAVPVITVNTNEDKKISAAGCDCGGDHVFYDTEEILEGTVSIECPTCKSHMSAVDAGMWD